MAKFVVEQEIFDYIFGWWWLQERIEKLRCRIITTAGVIAVLRLAGVGQKIPLGQ